jgi:hypothetical protein
VILTLEERELLILYPEINQRCDPPLPLGIPADRRVWRAGARFHFRLQSRADRHARQVGRVAHHAERYDWTPVRVDSNEE